MRVCPKKVKVGLYKYKVLPSGKKEEVKNKFSFTVYKHGKMVEKFKKWKINLILVFNNNFKFSSQPTL